ncbi:hypothetical protein C5167_045841 [Papaver somniferum]|uniref:Uncharacterized protein n=1 Tax=Papaver somniferum TaxID=3469 RepID=A0A4Y7LC14_PAPSO|nr:hypothetical protein C5167_045841 [Papaver somniferum]
MICTNELFESRRCTLNHNNFSIEKIFILQHYIIVTVFILKVLIFCALTVNNFDVAYCLLIILANCHLTCIIIFPLMIHTGI